MQLKDWDARYGDRRSQQPRKRHAQSESIDASFAGVGYCVARRSFGARLGFQPVFMIPQCSECTIPCMNQGHLFQTARKKRYRVRNEISGEDKYIRLECDDRLSIASYRFGGHVNTSMDISKLNNPERVSEGQGEFLDIISLAGIGCAI